MVALLALLSLLSSPLRASDQAPTPEDFGGGQASSNAPFDEFQSKPRYVNFRLDPVAPLQFDLFLKQWGGTIDIALGPNFTLGPSVRGGPSYKQGDSYAIVYKYGITGGWYLNGTRLTDSFVVWPNWFFATSTSNHAGGLDTVTGVMDAKEASVLVGFQWFYDHGWNVNIAGGLKYRYDVSNITITNDKGVAINSDLKNGISVATELMIGWAWGK
jgi:hypothetical protein